MKVYVKNYGPIDEATFELNELTIITGPNGSGKTYILRLFDALLKTWYKTDIYPFFSEELKKEIDFASNYYSVEDNIILLRRFIDCLDIDCLLEKVVNDAKATYLSEYFDEKTEIKILQDGLVYYPKEQDELRISQNVYFNFEVDDHSWDTIRAKVENDWFDDDSRFGAEIEEILLRLESEEYEAFMASLSEDEIKKRKENWDILYGEQESDNDEGKNEEDKTTSKQLREQLWNHATESYLEWVKTLQREDFLHIGKDLRELDYSDEKEEILKENYIYVAKRFNYLRFSFMNYRSQKEPVHIFGLDYDIKEKDEDEDFIEGQYYGLSLNTNDLISKIIKIYLVSIPQSFEFLMHERLGIHFASMMREFTQKYIVDGKIQVAPIHSYIADGKVVVAPIQSDIEINESTAANKESSKDKHKSWNKFNRMAYLLSNEIKILEILGEKMNQQPLTEFEKDLEDSSSKNFRSIASYHEKPIESFYETTSTFDYLEQEGITYERLFKEHSDKLNINTWSWYDYYGKFSPPKNTNSYYVDTFTATEKMLRSTKSSFEVDALLGGSFKIKEVAKPKTSKKGSSQEPEIVNNLYFNDISGAEVPIHRSSGKVSSLHSIWKLAQAVTIFNKYPIYPNVKHNRPLAIIDEPELSLHPETQRKLVNVLAQLVNAGCRIMLVTHSDYIIRQLNILIALKHKKAKVKRKLMQDFELKKAQLIDKEKVTCYVTQLSGEGNTGYTFEKCRISETYGIEARAFNDVINEMNRTLDDIIYTTE